MSVLSVAMVIAMLTAAFILLRWPMWLCEGDNPLPRLTFLAILFTSGLDVGLIMFPLVDFEAYATESDYSFANPLAIEFGFWGGLVWSFYFLTTIYFCALEPKLRLFELPLVKLIHNFVIIGTCAFTGYLFLIYLPSYIEGISPNNVYLLVAAVVLLAVVSSTSLNVLKVLSLVSTSLFLMLIVGVWLLSGEGVSGLAGHATALGAYFTNLDKFILPLNDYHGFYLSWWFAWSIMIGQFVARFVSGIPVWQLAIALLVVPSIPIALWFTVLYSYFVDGESVGELATIAMIGVGILFVVNSLDSLTRLYSQNLNLTVERLGRSRYVLAHASLLIGLVALYQFTPMKIEWVGMIVIGLYAFVYYAVARSGLRRRAQA